MAKTETKERSKKAARAVVGDVISLTDVQEAYEIIEAYKKAKASFDEIKNKYDAMDEAFVTRINNGAMVDPMVHDLYIVGLKSSERRNVSWRGVVEEIKGKAFAEKVLAETVPSVTQHLNVEPKAVRIQKV